MKFETPACSVRITLPKKAGRAAAGMAFFSDLVDQIGFVHCNLATASYTLSTHTHIISPSDFHAEPAWMYMPIRQS